MNKPVTRSSMSRWLRAVVLFPLSILMGVGEADGGSVAVETPAAEPAAPVVDAEREAAIQRGDIIVTPPAETISADVLAKIAEETGEAVAGVVKKDDTHIPMPRFKEDRKSVV